MMVFCHSGISRTGERLRNFIWDAGLRSMPPSDITIHLYFVFGREPAQIMASPEMSDGMESIAAPPDSLVDFFKKLNCTLFRNPRAPHALAGDLNGGKEWITHIDQDSWDERLQGTQNSTWISKRSMERERGPQ